MKRYAGVWWKLARMSFLMQMTNRWSSLGWLGGKLVRLGFYFVFITAIFGHVSSVAGYSLAEVALFFLTFNIVDNVAPLFLRGIYMIGRDIREGDMDFYLIQPVNPLFRIASNLVDFLDFFTLIPVIVVTAVILPKVMPGVPFWPALGRVGLYLALCANGVVIAFCLHVLIASLTVRTQQMENTIWLYRDLVSLGRFPVDIYAPFLRLLLTFVLPIAAMVTIPTRALLGLASPKAVLLALALSAGLTVLSLKSWKGALKHYSSVSS